eukprot:COSAG05_NODE_198_length_14502_cov_41.134416_4_plen_141_part_00
MNFQGPDGLAMAELSWEHGYHMFWVLVLVLTSSVLGLLHKLGFLRTGRVTQKFDEATKREEMEAQHDLARFHTTPNLSALEAQDKQRQAKDQATHTLRGVVGRDLDLVAGEVRKVIGHGGADPQSGTNVLVSLRMRSTGV